MLLLARAQSLSGRPGDALVMLDADGGSRHHPRDVATDPDFARVRALPRLAAARSELTARPANLHLQHRPAPAPLAPLSTDSTSQHRPASVRLLRSRRRAVRAGARRRVTPFRPRRSPRAPAAGRGRGVAQRRELRERGVAPASTSELTAFTLDARRGDLWVVEHARGRRGSAPRSLHKLQLVSGRAAARGARAGEGGSG